MTGIDCTSFLTWIQLLVTFDFSLFILDEKGWVNSLYLAYQENIKWHISKVLQSSKNALERTKDSSMDACIWANAYLAANYARLKYLTSRKTSFDGWTFLALYSGIYGLICMFFLAFFHCEKEYFAQTYILICAQLVAIIELCIILRMCVLKMSVYKRNIVNNVVISLVVLLVAWILSYFNWTFKCLSNFEIPFILSLGLIAMPIIVAVFYIIKELIKICVLRRRCNKYIGLIQKICAQ